MALILYTLYIYIHIFVYFIHIYIHIFYIFGKIQKINLPIQIETYPTLRCIFHFCLLNCYVLFAKVALNYEELDECEYGTCGAQNLQLG